MAWETNPLLRCPCEARTLRPWGWDDVIRRFEKHVNFATVGTDPPQQWVAMRKEVFAELLYAMWLDGKED